MFCGKCGAEMHTGGKFCPSCGNAVAGMAPSAPNVPSVQSIHIHNSNAGVSCPNCRSTNLHVSTESNTTSIGGGYSGGKGCLGFLLLGPLGLLCGSCGSKQKISTTNQTFWICGDCGNKFRNAQELMQESQQKYKACTGLGIFFAILTLVVFIAGIAAHADIGSSLDVFFIIMGIICVIFTVMLFAVGKKSKDDYEMAKGQHAENQGNVQF